ncbi:hypothetical protein D3C76_1701930 [compost metagenome]
MDVKPTSAPFTAIRSPRRRSGVIAESRDAYCSKGMGPFRSMTIRSMASWECSSSPGILGSAHVAGVRFRAMNM